MLFVSKMTESTKRSFADAESIETEERPSAKRRKPRNSTTLLAELRPGNAYQFAAQYGSPDDPTYIMQISVDGRVFQGIGPSKKKAKVMAAEYALLHLGAISALAERPPDVTEEPYCWEDFTADLADTNSALYFDFNYSGENAARDSGNTTEQNDAIESSKVNRVNTRLIGKNTLTILMDLHPNAFYRLVDSIVDNVQTKFAMECHVDRQAFRGFGMSKKLAKARAAREALRKLNQMEFGVAADGMPVYEGDEKIWLDYKAQLEKEAELKLRTDDAGTNPVQQLSEYFPEAKYDFPETNEKPDISDFHICNVIINGVTYEGSGMSKKDAKSDVASVALSELAEKGILEQMDAEMEAKRQEHEEKKKANEKLKTAADGGTERKSIVYKSALAKLNDCFQNLEYRLISETPLKNTCIVAFTMAISVKGKTYAGVGKNKKMAKLDVAEKALRDLGMWTEQDSEAKERMKTEDDDVDFMETSKRSWNKQSHGNWGGHGPADGMGWRQGDSFGANWDGSSNQHGGFQNDYNGMWGYYGGDGSSGWGQGDGSSGWGQGVPNHENFEAYQPIMQQLVGTMFENTFGSNPWRPTSGPGATNMESNPGFPPPSNSANGGANYQPGGNFSGPVTSSSASAVTTFANTNSSSSDKLVKPSAPYIGRGSYWRRGNPKADKNSTRNFASGSGNSSKYSNFRSAGFDTGFGPSFPTTTTVPSMQSQPSGAMSSTYGPYGTPMTQPPPDQNMCNTSTLNSSGVYNGSSVGNHTSLVTSTTQSSVAFQGGSSFTPANSGGLEGATGGGQHFRAADSYHTSKPTTDTNYSDYANRSYDYAATSSGMQNPSVSSLNSFPNSYPVMDNSTVPGYGAGGSYPQAGVMGYQSGGMGVHGQTGSGGAYGVQMGMMSNTVPTTVYQSKQVNYSPDFQSNAFGANGSGYVAGNFQSQTGDGGYMAPGASGNFQSQTGDRGYMAPGASTGYYGMYGGGNYAPGQGYGDFGYDGSGSYNSNPGYGAGGYQSADYGYQYSGHMGAMGTDSYSTATTKTSW